MRPTPDRTAAPLPLPAWRGAAPAASAPADISATLELSSEGGVFCNDFLIPLAFDRWLGNQSDLADRFGVLQVRVNRRHHHARFNGDEVDANQRHAHPRIDDNSLVEYTIENVNETCAAGSSFNGHLTLLQISNTS